MNGTIRQMKFGSLFAGIGGFDLGFERAGMQSAWQVEIDEQCRETLAKHWPDVQRYGDITELKGEDLEPVDLICGGFPCQDLSVAGRREGLDGERSGLWFEFHRILSETRPPWVVVENVTGLLSSGEPKWSDLAIIFRGLAELGYMGSYRVLDAQYFGVAQRRRRVFIIGYLGSGSAIEVLLEQEGLPGDPPSSEAEGKRIAGTIGKRIARSHTELDGHGAYIIQQNQRNEVRKMDKAGSLQKDAGMKQQNYVYDARGHGDGEKSNTLTGDHMNRVTDYTPVVASPLRGRSSRNSNVPGRGGEDDENIVAFRMQAFGQYAEDDKASAMKERDHKDATDLITERLYGMVPGNSAQSHSIGAQEEKSPPVRGGGAGAKPTIASSRVGVRRLTPTECERLQGFPDGWTEGHADTPRYAMLGNAVCVPVAEWIGRRILEHAALQGGDDE